MDKTTPEHLTTAAKNLTDKLATSTIEAVGTGKSSVDHNLDRARVAMEKGIDYLEAAHSQVNNQARRTAKYVGDHPGNALLIAAGVGAFIYLLATLCAPRRTEDGYNEYRGRRW